MHTEATEINRRLGYFKHKFWRERILYLGNLGSRTDITTNTMPSVNPNAAAALAVGIPVAFAGFLRIKYGPTIWEDFQKLKRAIAIKKEANMFIADGTSIIDIYEAHAKKNPEKPFVLFEDTSYSYGEIDREANKMVSIGMYRLERSWSQIVLVFRLYL